jgi:glycerol-3-phosphate acyltransferase PlsY
MFSEIFTGELCSGYLVAAFSYLIGSIPFGLVLTKIFGLGDIRKIGSGNIGATNVLRTGSKKIAIATLLLDAMKGAIAVIVARHFSPLEHATLFAGTLAVLGHIYPVWLKFKGGKGVATTLAVLIAFYPPLGISACIIWLISFVLIRVSSLSAVLTMTASPVVAFFFVENTGFGTVYVTLFLSIIVVSRHSSNIRRLVVGQEKQIDWKNGK